MPHSKNFLEILFSTLGIKKLWSLTSTIYFAGVCFFCLQFLKFKWIFKISNTHFFQKFSIVKNPQIVKNFTTLCGNCHEYCFAQILIMEIILTYIHIIFPIMLSSTSLSPKPQFWSKINWNYSRLYRWRAALKPVHLTSSTYNIRKPIINKWNFILLISPGKLVEIWKVISVERPDILACTSVIIDQLYLISIVSRF